MMHLTFADKSLILGNAAAELTVEYAAALARIGSADTVRLVAYGSDGDKVTATLLLDAGAPLMIETSATDLPEPDNTDTVAYMTQRMSEINSPPQASPISQDDGSLLANLENSL
jgi:hypothetical protein